MRASSRRLPCRPAVVPLALGSVLCLVAGSAAAAGGSTYLALGDSLGFGYESIVLTQRTPGDQGYARLFADHLGSVAGVRPNLINLSVPQESTASFFTGGQIGRFLNTNYPLDPTSTLTQAQLLTSTIAAERAAGRSIDHVTLQLGANDLIDLATPGFFAQPVASQIDAGLALLPTIRANIASVLTTLTVELPDADIRLVGYYNPFALFVDQPVLDPSASGEGVAFSRIAGPLLGALNTTLEDLAGDFGVSFVPVADRFVGREAELTRITATDLGSPNIHPTALGYAEMAAAIIAVPTPGAAGLLAFAGVLAVRRRR